MDFPGEKFLIKVLETLSKTGVGLAAPWQTRRVGISRADLKAYEIRAIAAAERDAQDLRAGVKVLDSNNNVVPRPLLEHISQVEPRNGEVESPPSLAVLTDARTRTAYRELKREANLRKIALLASDSKVDDEEVADTPVDDGWAARWVDGAQDISDDDLRTLWANLLAREVKRPGSYSLHTVEFLRQVSHADAKKIEKLAPFAIKEKPPHNSSIIYLDKELLARQGISTDLLIDLEESGIINTAGMMGLSKDISAIPNPLGFQHSFGFGVNKLLIAKSENESTRISIKCYKFTRVGAEILSLGSFEPNKEYVSAFVEHLKRHNVEVFGANVLKWRDEGITVDAWVKY